MLDLIKFVIIGAVFTLSIIFVIIFTPQNFGHGQQKFTVSPPTRPSEYSDFMRWYELVITMTELVERHRYVSLYELTPMTAGNNTLYALEIKSQPEYKKSGVLVIGAVDAMAWSSAHAVVELAFKILFDKRNYRFLADYDWYLIPVVNPDGYEYTLSVRDLRPSAQGVWRRNMSGQDDRPLYFHKNLVGGADTCFGVNVALNFPYHWGEHVSKDNCSQLYAGNKPLSESEACAVKQYVDRLSGVVNVAVQLGATYTEKKEAILYPWAYAERSTINDNVLQKVGEAAARATPLQDGRIIEVDQYSYRHPDIGGTAIDYIMGVAGIELVYLVHLYHLPMPCSTPAGEDLRELRREVEEPRRPMAKYVNEATAIVLGLVKARAKLVTERALNFFGKVKHF